MYLFFDTETTGLPRNWRAPVTDVNNWPRLVQLAYLQYDNEGYLISKGKHIILPEGFTIPVDSARIHGITTERAAREGVKLSRVLNEFNQLIADANYLVAHNMSFDEKIVGCEFLRNQMLDPIPANRRIAPCSRPQIFATFPDSMVRNGQSFPSCTISCSMRISTRRIMRL